MLPTIKTDQGVLSYNDHLQLSTLRYYKSGSSTDILSLAYDYGAKRMKQLGQSIRTVLDPHEAYNMVPGRNPQND